MPPCGMVHVNNNGIELNIHTGDLCKPSDVTGVWHCRQFLVLGSKCKSSKTI